jgi:hypothetical protein
VVIMVFHEDSVGEPLNPTSRRGSDWFLADEAGDEGGRGVCLTASRTAAISGVSVRDKGRMAVFEVYCMYWNPKRGK